MNSGITKTDDTSKAYNIFVNLRISNEYKYSNMFMMMYQTSPSKQVQKERKEFTLADETGRWLGRGLGDLYDYQIVVDSNAHFTEKGIYRFELEQNMRNDTLMHVKSAGIRIEDAALAKHSQ